MVDLKKFRKDNGLLQREVAEYLGVNVSFVTNIECGRNNIPQDKLERLIKNDRGWDVSSLVVGSGNVILGGQGNTLQLSGRSSLLLTKEIDALKAENELLRRQLDEVKAEKDRYWEMIGKLMNK